MSDSSGQTNSSDRDASGELPPRLLSKLKVEVEGYELLNRLGAGGQATVYRARRLNDGLIVAVKILHSGPHADEQARARLKREARALMALKHPNIVHAIAAGRTRSGLDCLVMNYIEGRPLDALWEDSEFAAAVAPEPPPPPAARLRLFKQICETVQAAHRKGITHRDLSPSNILIDKQGQPHILDFGMASTAFDHLPGRGITVTGQFIGKIKYASPEQARGAGSAGASNGSVDIRSDVYALGVMLYQLLTDGAFPYEVVGNVIDVLNNIIHSRPRPPSELLAGAASTISVVNGKPAKRIRRNPPLVNETIEAIVLKALEKDPDRRYQSAGELAADIDHYLAGRPTSAGLWSRSRGRHLANRLRGVARLASFFASVLLIGALTMNFRTVVAWIGFSAASFTPPMTPEAMAQPEGSDRRLSGLADDLARVDARLREVNTQLADATSRKLPELEERAGSSSGILTAEDFCAALTKSASETGRSLVFEPLRDEDREREKQAESDRIGRETDLEVLLSRRARLDSDQAVLWARLAWGTFSGREADKLYRFRLKPVAKEDAAGTAKSRIVESGVKLRGLMQLTMETAATQLAAPGTSAEEPSGIADTLASVAEQVQGPFADFPKAGRAAQDAGNLTEEESKAVSELRKLAEGLRDHIDGSAESQRQAANAQDEQARFTARGRLQRDLLAASDAAARFDTQLVKFALDSNMDVDPESARPPIKAIAAAAKRRPDKPRPSQQETNRGAIADALPPNSTWSGTKRQNGESDQTILRAVITNKGNGLLELETVSRDQSGSNHYVIENRGGNLVLKDIYYKGSEPRSFSDVRGSGTVDAERLRLDFSFSCTARDRRTHTGVASLDLRRDGAVAAQNNLAADPLAAWVAGSRWVNTKPPRHAGLSTWTVRSRNGDQMEIQRPSIANGTVVVSLKVNGTGVTVTGVRHDDGNRAMDREWNGSGTIGPNALSLTYSVESKSGNGKWERWPESINLEPE